MCSLCCFAKEGASSDLLPAAQEEEPLPNILDVLSSEELDISWNSIATSVVTPSSENLIFITPGRHESGDDCKDKVHHNRGVCDVGSIMPAKRKAGDDYENKVQHHRGGISDNRSTTHAKRKAEDNVKDKVLHFRVNLFDDMSMSKAERKIEDEYRGEVLPYRTKQAIKGGVCLNHGADRLAEDSADTRVYSFISMNMKVVNLSADQAMHLRYPIGCPVWYNFSDLIGACLNYCEGVVLSAHLDILTKTVFFKIKRKNVSAPSLIDTVCDDDISYAPNCPVVVSSTGTTTSEELRGVVLFAKPARNENGSCIMLYTVSFSSRGNHIFSAEEGVTSDRLKYLSPPQASSYLLDD
jgi:hypothetical protein